MSNLVFRNANVVGKTGRKSKGSDQKVSFDHRIFLKYASQISSLNGAKRLKADLKVVNISFPLQSQAGSCRTKRTGTSHDRR